MKDSVLRVVVHYLCRTTCLHGLLLADGLIESDGVTATDCTLNCLPFNRYSRLIASYELTALDSLCHLAQNTNKQIRTDSLLNTSSIVVVVVVVVDVRG